MWLSARAIYFAVHGKPAPRKSPRRRLAGRGPARSWRYRAWIRTLPSVVSGIAARIEAAHTGSDGGMRQKPSDYSCIPLTVEEHREYHQLGKDRFEAKHNIDCREIVRTLNRAWFAFSSEVK